MFNLKLSIDEGLHVKQTRLLYFRRGFYIVLIFDQLVVWRIWRGSEVSGDIRRYLGTFDSVSRVIY